MTETQRNYAGFWDRSILITILVYFFWSVVARISLFYAFADWDAVPRYEMISNVYWELSFGLITLILFFIWRKFSHITLLDKNKVPVKFSKQLQRHLLICFLPLIYGFYVIFNCLNYQEKLLHLFPDGFYLYGGEGLVSEKINPILMPLIPMQAIFFPLPFLAIIYIIDWVPFFQKKYKRPLHDIISGVHVVYSEKRKPSIIRTIIKVPLAFISFLFFILFTAIVSWTVYNIPDRPLDPEVKEFFYENDFKMEDNVRVAWAGLLAPEGTEDIYEYGLKIYKGEIEGTWELEFKGEISRDYFLGYERDRDLPSAVYIETLYNDNKELLDRYYTFYNYKNFGADNTLTSYGSGQRLITIHRFLYLYWEELAQNGKGEEAIEWWLKDMKLIQNMMGSNTGLVEKAIWMVNYGINLRSLPHILNADPSLIEKYEQSITEILSKDFMRDIWDVENTWRGEYNAVLDLRLSEFPHHYIFIKPNDMRNEFLKIAKDEIWVSRQSAYAIPEASSVLQKYHYDEPANYIFPYNILKMLLLPGFVKGEEMYINGYIKTAEQRALILWLQGRKQNIPSEKMNEFLQQAPENLYDPLINKPFRWDDNKNAIYLEKSNEDPDLRVNIFY